MSQLCDTYAVLFCDDGDDDDDADDTLKIPDDELIPQVTYSKWNDNQFSFV